MFKGPQGMSFTDNVAATASSSAATFVATTAADKTKMCASSLIFKATKWCFSLASGGYTTRTPHQEKINGPKEVPRADTFMKIDINYPQYT